MITTLLPTLIGLTLVITSGVIIGVTWIERQQANSLKTSLPYSSTEADKSSENLVVFFSRSGNTGLAARHIAKRLKAPMIQLQAKEYELGMVGLGHALKDAQANRKDAEITPRQVDMSAYRRIYIGSPVWLYSPASPVWSFIESNRFDGKDVVLFNTYNSNFSQDKIDEFKASVMQRGARSFRHVHVKRGRMTQQLEPDQMLREIEEGWSFN